VTFDDQAADAAGPVMTDGGFRPEEALSALNGEHALGDWILGMGDSFGADPLSYFSATLTINGGDNVAVPAPASLALLLAGLGVIGVTRRRQA